MFDDLESHQNLPDQFLSQYIVLSICRSASLAVSFLSVDPDVAHLFNYMLVSHHKKGVKDKSDETVQKQSREKDVRRHFLIRNSFSISLESGELEKPIANKKKRHPFIVGSVQ